MGDHVVAKRWRRRPEGSNWGDFGDGDQRGRLNLLTPEKVREGLLGELWYLKELAAWLCAAGRSRFLLTAPPLRLPGTVGSPVTPVATV